MGELQGVASKTCPEHLCSEFLFPFSSPSLSFKTHEFVHVCECETITTGKSQCARLFLAVSKTFHTSCTAQSVAQLTHRVMQTPGMQHARLLERLTLGLSLTHIYSMCSPRRCHTSLLLRRQMLLKINTPTHTPHHVHFSAP